VPRIGQRDVAARQTVEVHAMRAAFLMGAGDDLVLVCVAPTAQKQADPRGAGAHAAAYEGLGRHGTSLPMMTTSLQRRSPHWPSRKYGRRTVRNDKSPQCDSFATAGRLPDPYRLCWLPP